MAICLPAQMGKEFGWRLLTVVGVTFALAVTFQFLELPYGVVLPSSSSAPSSPDEAPGQGIGSGSSVSVNVVAVNSTTLHPALEEVADSDGFVYEGIMNNNSRSSTEFDLLHEWLVDANSSSTLSPEAAPDQEIDDDDDGDPEGISSDHFVSERITGWKNDSADETSSDLQGNNVTTLAADQEAKEGSSVVHTSPVEEEPSSSASPENKVDDSDHSAVSERIMGSKNDSAAETSSDSQGNNVTVVADGEAKEGSSIVAAVPTSPMAEEPSSSGSPAGSIAMAPAVHEEEASVKQDSNGTSDKVLQAADVTKPAAVTPPPPPPPPPAAPAVFTISEMNKLMLESLSSPNSIRPRWPSPADKELVRARSLIENAPIVTDDPMLYAPLYHNVSMFKRSYELMQKMLKVYVYREGERPIFHQPALKGIYASEGWFMKFLETSKKFVTKDPRKAHLFYLPFGSRNLEETLYVPGSHSHKNLIQHLKNYLDMVAAKHTFWNRTDGADHFLVACHDWAPAETKQYMSNCIRSLCNADIKEGFVFGKDTSLPETYVRNAQKPLRDLGGQPPSKRSTLAFFAGNMHGYVRPILLQHWENKDPEMKIYGNMPRSKGNKNYINHMRSSKYCICPKGYEVNSPRVVEAIFHDCVPVIISDNFVPPFLEVLNWESFAVFVMEKDIPDLKRILVGIPERRYLQMQMRVRKVQQHFLWHPRPVKYDVFHMVLHSIWYNRVFRS
ncbi:unnamed protein product [Linum tenue]|uniref:Exostosin GT47 domain-containing protein n=1 Tax=Linum tenue TaxID=586396 RepID=A0AAV0M538_9ROSI|nr:unnamed protein product [Linum tenue]